MEGTKIFPMTLKQYFECTSLMEYLVKAELQKNIFLPQSAFSTISEGRSGVMQGGNKAICLDQCFQCKQKKVQFFKKLSNDKSLNINI